MPISSRTAESQPPLAAELCRLLVWDSQFFGCRIACVNGHRLDPDRADAILQWCRDEQIDCLYFLADSDDRTTTVAAEDRGFHLVDIRLTLALRVDDRPAASSKAGGVVVRPHLDCDLPALRRIAGSAYRDTRFYFDARFPTGRVDELYATWIERSCSCVSAVVYVVEAQGRPVGYITCHRDDDLEGRIGLIAVDSSWQHAGFGHRLLDAAHNWFAVHQVRRVMVTTQGRNIEAQRFYQKYGFVTDSVRLWYHRWF